MPKSGKLPPGVVGIPALMLQLQGWLWVLYGAIYPYLHNQNLLLHGIGLLVGMILILNYGRVLYQRSSYELK
jgi:hypothetical protein